MAKTVSTSITAIVENDVSDQEVKSILEDKNYESLDEYATELESDLEGILVGRVFSRADNIVLMDVSTEVKDNNILEETEPESRTAQESVEYSDDQD